MKHEVMCDDKIWSWYENGHFVLVSSVILFDLTIPRDIVSILMNLSCI